MFQVLDLAKRCVLGCELAVALLLQMGGSAQAKDVRVLHSFSGGNDGANPFASLTMDTKGSLYSTTSTGGVNNQGVVFKLDPDGTETVLYAFCVQNSCTDGANPQGAVFAGSDGNFYGTTKSGGTLDEGTVYRLAPDGAETVLHSFGSNGDGTFPYSSLIADKKGNLSGTTSRGGKNDQGAVFEISPNGSETVLYSFTGGSDGALPGAGLLLDKAGNLDGVTTFGGANGEGVVFELKPNGRERVLYAFTGGADGGEPYGDLVSDRKDNLYSTTFAGGKQDCSGPCGAVFELTPGGMEKVLFRFDGRNGDKPLWGLKVDKSGNLFGNTTYGGPPRCFRNAGCGVAFEISADGTYTVLHRFTGNKDGANPQGDPVKHGKGNIYFALYDGGTYGYGAVVSVKGTE